VEWTSIFFPVWFDRLAFASPVMIQTCCSALKAARAADQGVLHGIFGWWPMVWTLRIGLLIIFLCLLYIFILNVLRFFRPANAKAMITGPLPRLRQLGGKIAGVEATASLVDSDLSTGQQMERVNQRIDDVIKRVDSLAVMVEQAGTAGDADDEA